MQPISNMQKAPSLQDIDMQGINAYFDAHPIVPAAMGLFVLALIVLNFWNKRKEKEE